MRDSTLILSLKIGKGSFVGYYAIIAETTENMQTITKQDEVEVNYLKKSFGSGLQMKMTLIQGKFKTWFMLMLKLMGALESRNTINE